MTRKHLVGNRIAPPMYNVGRYVLNEYELRMLMRRVAEGIVTEEITVTDEKGVSAKILPTGFLSRSLFGMGICTSLTRDILIINKEKEQGKYR